MLRVAASLKHSGPSPRRLQVPFLNTGWELGRKGGNRSWRRTASNLGPILPNVIGPFNLPQSTRPPMTASNLRTLPGDTPIKQIKAVIHEDGTVILGVRDKSDFFPLRLKRVVSEETVEQLLKEAAPF